jgi:GrpB-like predicted nucleotidyltransferase (UPF0157 family)/RimJ/RimL family protein N-acetyltransferase
MNGIVIRELEFEDKDAFLAAMQQSQTLHHPWVNVPLTSQEFDDYWQRCQQANQYGFLVCGKLGRIKGVFNLSEIVQGTFQSAYLGFYAVAEYAGQGYMSAGLKLILQKVFKELNLHRIEINIQPENIRSIMLVKNHGFRNEGFSPRYLKVNGVWQGHEHWAMTYEDFIKNDEDVLERDHIDITPYNPKWPAMADFEIKRLQKVFPDNNLVDIQHVGSTAIPGLSAKPIIDIQVAVNALNAIKPIAIQELAKLAYEYWFENPDPSKMFFVKGMPPFGEKRTHHVHIVEYASTHWKNKIIFRDYLRAHPNVAKDYEALKNKLAVEHAFERERYTDAKLEFVNHVLKLAS